MEHEDTTTSEIWEKGPRSEREREDKKRLQDCERSGAREESSLHMTYDYNRAKSETWGDGGQLETRVRKSRAGAGYEVVGSIRCQ